MIIVTGGIMVGLNILELADRLGDFIQKSVHTKTHLVKVSADGNGDTSG